ncbi:hypothetical protein R3P38DRAFT_2761638 [Favolaschia claudopus]|uniref:Uncharacterized protein n=1 Tax=Favolaschia claudopus TaxID=2862362 RepID=A0AAW0DQN7_9AGAR
MGRRRKYHSLDEKASAQRQSNLKYSQSAHGKIVLSTYRASTHLRKQRKIAPTKPLPDTLPLVPLPTPRQLELYHSPLPTHSQFFIDALRSSDTLDESDLARWKTEPPFEEDCDSADPHSAPYLRFTNSLTEVLHGVRLREQKQQEAEMREELIHSGQEGMLHRLRYDVLKKSQIWRQVEKLEKEVGDNKLAEASEPSAKALEPSAEAFEPSTEASRTFAGGISNLRRRLLTFAEGMLAAVCLRV